MINASIEQGSFSRSENYGPMPSNRVDSRTPLVPPVESNPHSRVERLKEKRQPSLGELNPMLFAPEFGNADCILSIKDVVTNQIIKRGGLLPTSFESRVLSDEQGKLYPRLIAKFELEDLTEEQVLQLEELVVSTYGDMARTRKASSGHAIRPTNYPTVETTSRGRPRVSEQNRMLGWHMGVAANPPTPLDTGVFVYKDLGGADMAQYVRNKKPEDWFFNSNLVDPMHGKKVKTKYVMEMREAGLFQTDIATLVTQMGNILSGNGLVSHSDLFYDVYNSLNRLGLKKAGKEDIYGLDDAIERLQRTLILPLANLELGVGIDLKPGSALLIGVPGTGKTLIAEHFLQRDTGVFIVPVDASQLAADLSKQPEQRRILTRINKVFSQTQIPIVLHIDDIENIAQNETQVNTTLLNLMAGVRETGFFVMASTNYPEKLSPQLLQPQRFANIIYFGLQDEKARKGILDVHATRVSREMGKSLFSSDEDREALLEALSKHTKDFTPRYLADICTEAKSFLLARLALSHGRSSGLQEEDLDQNFTVEDWEQALREVERKYNKEEMVKRDKELSEIAEKHYKQMGFVAAVPGQAVLTKTIEELTAARQAKVTLTEN